MNSDEELSAVSPDKETVAELSTIVTAPRDELNLAEFPLSAIADRIESGAKTLTFSDKRTDPMDRTKTVTRSLTITAADAYGLPTATDDEVILALVQVSKQQGFKGRKVCFSRSQLLSILGWAPDGKNYRRLEDSLNRWIGVTLSYEKAWWNKEAQAWVNEKFHILDNVTLLDRDSLARARQRSGPDAQTRFPFSSFTWNDVIYRSFSSGNLKSIDYELYRKLRSAISKRLYRFLDKYFYRRPVLVYDLEELCFEHVGLSRKYDTGNLKRKLRIGIDELTVSGYLKATSDEERFKKVAGVWKVTFEKADEREGGRDKSSVETGVQPNGALREGQGSDADRLQLQRLLDGLTQRGVSSSVALKFVSEYPSERIVEQIEVFDWMMERNDKRIATNPGGFLAASIRESYTKPKGYLTPEERRRKEELALERKRRNEERKRLHEQARTEREEAQKKALRSFWESLSAEDRVKHEELALKQADRFLADVIARGGTLAEAAKQNVFDDYATSMLRK